MTINFANETQQSLNDRFGISSLDFCGLAGSRVTATLIDHRSDCGPAKQDGMVFELQGAEVRYACLTNGPTIWSDSLDLGACGAE